MLNMWLYVQYQKLNWLRGSSFAPCNIQSFLVYFCSLNEAFLGAYLMALNLQHFWVFSACNPGFTFSFMCGLSPSLALSGSPHGDSPPSAWSQWRQLWNNEGRIWNLPWVMALAFNLSIWGKEADGFLWVWDQSGLYSMFQDKRCYIIKRFCLKNNKIK